MKKQITFPVVVKKKGVPFVAPNASLYYILAADGWYQVKKNKMYETCAKVTHEVPGYETQKEYCRTNMPVIPNDIMDRVMSFFRRVYTDLGGEAIVELFHQPDTGEWRVVPPYQGIPTIGRSTGYWRGSAYAGMGMGEWPYGEDSPSGITSAYGTKFEEHSEIHVATVKYEIWDANVKKYVPCLKGTKGSVKAITSGGWGHDLIYMPSKLEDWPEGFRRIGTIHSHPTSDAYFSLTDDQDDRYGDGMHLVFGFVQSTMKIQISRNVKASFCANGQRFQWDKEDNDSVVEEFIDIDTPVPPEWLKRCHEVKDKGGQYVSVKHRKVKKAPKPPVLHPVKGPRAAKPSNVRLIQPDGSFKEGTTPPDFKVGTDKGKA